MSLVATLKANEQLRTAEAKQQYRELISRAQTLDEYRSLLARDDSEETPALVDLMAQLELTTEDVEADVQALRERRNLQGYLLTPGALENVKAKRAADLEQIRNDTLAAVTQLWALLPAESCPVAFLEVFNALRVAFDENGHQQAAKLNRYHEWSARAEQAVEGSKRVIANDRQARASLFTLETQNHRVLAGDPELSAA